MAARAAALLQSSMDLIHDGIEPLCRATAQYDLAGPCTGAKLIILFALHAVGFLVVYAVWGAPKRGKEDSLMRFAADELLPSAGAPAAASSGVRAADRSGLRQR